MELGKSEPGQLEHLAKGDVVTIPNNQLPNDDPKHSRPYVVLWESETRTYTVCTITKQPHRDHKVILECRDFLEPRVLDYNPSYARPNYVYTLEQNETWQKIGTLKLEKIEEILQKFKEFVDQPRIEAPRSKALERPKPRIR